MSHDDHADSAVHPDELSAIVRSTGACACTRDRWCEVHARLLKPTQRAALGPVDRLLRVRRELRDALE
jgi:hypothetical protein